MIIKKEKKKKRKIFFSFNRFLYFYFFSTLTASILIVVAILQSQTFEQKKKKFLHYLYEGGRIEHIYLPQIAFKALKSNFYKIDDLNLEIKFDDILKIEKIRKDAIAKVTEHNNALPSSDKMPKIKAKVIFNKKKRRGDIRLKGDRKIHWEEKEKSSYKIELDKDQYILGIKKFSLQKPRARNYIHEWIFHQMSDAFDIIKLKYEFLNLTINGEDKGLYVLEEGFGKELIERNKRRNGPIFGLDEDLTSTLEIKDSSDNIVFEIYNKKYWNREENKNILNIASQKLRDLLNRKIPPEEVLDLKKWAGYFAIIDLTSTYHGAFLKSVKFYYNPINGLFEPIPFDGHRLKQNYHKYFIGYDNRLLIDRIIKPERREEISVYSWLKIIFLNKDGSLNQSFYNLYLKSLNTISSKKYLDNFISENINKIEQINSHIYADYFYFDNWRNYGVGIYYFLLSDFYYQANNIREKIEKSQIVQILKKSNSDLLIKDIPKRDTLNYSPLFVDKIICNKNNQNITIKIEKLLNAFSDTSIKLPEKKKNLECTHVSFVDKINRETILLKIDYLNSEYSYDSFKNLNLELLKNYFVQVHNNLFLKSDEVEIDKNLYIPRGFNVVIKQGQKILLINNAFIISNSPWRIGGKEKLTIISGKKNNLGGGILIADTNKLSKIQNTEISYLTGYNIDLNNEYLILGSINFHQTNLEINNTYFKNIFSEDAINIFRSNFIINNVNYKDISSDAVDVDFSDGEINNAHFVNINNDAIDFSGSKVVINDAYFNNVRDKLISAGEESNISIYEIKGINSFAGIVSKDGSEVYSENVNFDGVQIPFAAYQKKKEYSHGSLIAKNYIVNNFLVKSIKDKPSKIFIKDKSIEIDSNKILPIIYEKKLSLIKQ